MKTILNIKLPFFAVAGSVCAYYGFAPAYASGNAAATLPFAVLLVALVSFFRVMDCARVSVPQTRWRLKKAHKAALYLAAGFAIGVACRGGANRSAFIFPGLETENIVAVRGTLMDDPRNTASGRGMAALRLDTSYGKGRVEASAVGEILVFFPEGSIPRLKEFGRNSRIYIEGSFATAGSAYSRTPLFRARNVHVTHPPSRFEQWRTEIRLSLIDAFSPADGSKKRDWGGLALALLLGIRDNLDGELAEKYRDAGCSYILALSGMHLAIVSSVIAFFLKKPLGKRLAAACGIVFILLYVFLVGVQPSLLRAAIMYVLGAIAIIYALPVNAALLLGLSFIIQILVQPASGDTVSFILSYLALAGILSLGQYIGCLVRGYLPECAAAPVSASLGAFLGTMAVCSAFFGSLQPVSIAAGLLLAPLTTFFMIGSIAYLPLYFIVRPLSAIAVYALSLAYRLLEAIAAIAGRFPKIMLSNVLFSITISLIMPVAVTFVYYFIQKKRNYLEKFA
ncbi:MAG: ComEC/Rec2 family competence protein [Spirochaetaceae bacterium]|jgi:competence protein ComEC|nr:ComEC/Rec2 family competence protein [Spirochaetaceae bacterium]